MKYKKFEHLIDQEVWTKDNSKSYIVTPELIESSVNSWIKRKRSSKELNLDKKITDAQIVELYITDEEVLSLIPSQTNLVKGSEGLKKEVKLDEIRETGLGLDKYAGYSIKEKEAIEERLRVYKAFYFGDGEVAPNDEWDLMDIIRIEAEIDELNALIRLNPNKKYEEERKVIEKLRKQRSEALLGLNAKKSQRDNTKNKPKETGDLSSVIDQLDKSIDDMKREVELEKQQEKEMVRKLSKKDNKNAKEDI